MSYLLHFDTAFHPIGVFWLPMLTTIRLDYTLSSDNQRCKHKNNSISSLIRSEVGFSKCLLTPSILPHRRIVNDPHLTIHSFPYHSRESNNSIIIILSNTVRMSNSDELVYLECIHKGCTYKRQFLKRRGVELPQYVCLRHRRLYLDVS